MTFNIGNQHGGIINNVGRDQTIHGDQRGEMVLDVAQGRALLAELRREVQAARLPAGDRASALGDIEACDRALDDRDPDPHSIGDRLGAVARVVVAAGAVASAGTGIGAALGALAAWLGPVGDAVRRMLPG